MKSVETEAKNLRGSHPKACEELGVSREDLEVEVLSTFQRISGPGAKNARIRATVKEKAAPPASEVRPSGAHSDPQAAETAKKTLQISFVS